MKRMLTSLIFLFIAGAIHAQDGYAAVLHVSYHGVELRRINTDAWISVAQGADMPIGAGDVLRTNESGRALIRFAEGTDLLLLPVSEFTIVRYVPHGDTMLLTTTLNMGRAVFTTSAAIEGYILSAGSVALTSVNAHGAVAVDDTATRIIVARGTIEFTGVENGQLTAREGVRITRDAAEQVSQIPSPSSFARLDSALDSCPGIALSSIRDSLNVRQGPGDGYAIIGEFLNGESIEIVATTPRHDRYRVRYLSSFGWIVSDAVITTCDNLPILSYDTLEVIYGVLDPTEDDLRLLEPFFGLFLDDHLFYPR